MTTPKDCALIMSPDDFDSIMGKVLGHEKKGGIMKNIHQDQKKHPGQLPTKRRRQYTDVRVTETPGTRPAPIPKKPPKMA